GEGTERRMTRLTGIRAKPLGTYYLSLMDISTGWLTGSGSISI
ncbi:1454_t:CDS:2, partial [Gigaspora rosea]